MLALRIQPDEGISLCFGSKQPGPDVVIRDVSMDFHYADVFHCGMDDAYHRLLLDAMLGDSTIVADWGDVHPMDYPAESWEPAAADDLLRNGRHSRQP